MQARRRACGEGGALSTGEISGGALLARCLASEAVKLVFGLPCPEHEPLLAALDGCRMRFVPARHEAAAVHMAEGVYTTSGQVAVVIGSVGPGSANLLSGVIAARHAGVPVLAITARGQDPLDGFRQAVKWSAPILAWERIPELVRSAFRELWLGRPGPVQLEVPLAVMHALGDARNTSLAASGQLRAAQPKPSEAQLEQAAQLLARAERPLVVAGVGVDRAFANAALVEIVELLACPVVTSMAGRAAVPLDHPNAISGFGPGADAVKREADVVLVVGSRLGDPDLPSDADRGEGARQALIQIDLDPRSLGASHRVALGIDGAARTALERLLGLLKARRVRRADANDLARYVDTERAWWAEQFAAIDRSPGRGIHPCRALQAIGRVFGPDAIYSVDGGHTSLWAHWSLPATRPRSYHARLELGMRGSGIPAALGAKLADPAREVVCVVGDCAAGFHFMEMQSAAREGLKLTAVVLVDAGAVRWDVVGEGLGCRGVYVDALDQLEPALQSARLAPGPTVVCLKTDREANLALPADLMWRNGLIYPGPGD